MGWFQFPHIFRRAIEATPPADAATALGGAEGALKPAQGEPAQVIPLTNFEVKFTTSLGDHLELRRQAFTELVGSSILRLFKISVVSTVGLTIALALLDAWFIKAGVIEPGERLVTEHVVMAIIGASIVQVGAASSAIVYSLFRQGREAAAAPESSAEPAAS